MRRISQALVDLLANSIEKHLEILGEVGATDIVRRTGQLYLYPDEKWLRKDARSWALRKEHGLRIERLGRDDILALEPEVGPDYTIGMFTPDQGMSINPYRQVTAIAADFARRGGQVVRDRVAAIEVEGDRVRAVRGEKCVLCVRSCGDVRGRLVDALLNGLGYALPLESQRGYHVTVASPGITVSRPVVAADRKVFLTPMEDGLRAAGTVEFGGLARAAEPQARRLSRARPVAGVSARADSRRLVVLDGAPAVLSRFTAGDGAEPPSRPVVQFRPRPSGADDVGGQRRYLCARDLRRAGEHRSGAVFVRAVRR